MSVKDSQTYILRKQWNDACLSIGMPALTTDTCARIMAVLLVHGNNEAFVLNGHFVADAEYIQEKFGIQGSRVPDERFAELLRVYVGELESYLPPQYRTMVKDLSKLRKDMEDLDKYRESHKGEYVDNQKPDWAVRLFKEMYDINI